MIGGKMWSLNNMRPTSEQTPLSPFHSSLPSSPSSSCNRYTHQSWIDGEGLPAVSWSQLLLGGLGEEDRCSSRTSTQQKKMDNWDPLLYQSASTNIMGVKQEGPEGAYLHDGHGCEEIYASSPSWSQIPPVSTSSSCLTNFSSNMLDFANKIVDGGHAKPDHSLECNSTTAGSASKKARVHSSSPCHPSSKGKKEKLGDRITVLHQLVSPFGKTDTASVLLEAIGYIRFLQNQIEALSSPYMRNASAESTRNHGERGSIFPEDPGQDDKEESKKDLRSRGLCLVPISCTMHVESDNGADFWAPAIGASFR